MRPRLLPTFPWYQGKIQRIQSIQASDLMTDAQVAPTYRGLLSEFPMQRIRVPGIGDQGTETRHQGKRASDWSIVHCKVARKQGRKGKKEK